MAKCHPTHCALDAPSSSPWPLDVFEAVLAKVRQREKAERMAHVRGELYRARLAAAAPHLLAALRELSDASKYSAEVVAIARAAVAKVEGQT